MKENNAKLYFFKPQSIEDDVKTIFKLSYRRFKNFDLFQIFSLHYFLDTIFAALTAYSNNKEIS